MAPRTGTIVGGNRDASFAGEDDLEPGKAAEQVAIERHLREREECHSASLHRCRSRRVDRVS